MCNQPEVSGPFRMETAKHLPNGAQIIRRSYNDRSKWWVVGCLWEGSVMPWVTWACDKDGDANWGHYFTNEDDMLADYESRVQRGH